MSKSIMSSQCDLFLCEIVVIDWKRHFCGSAPKERVSDCWVKNTEPEKQPSLEIKKIFLFCLKIDEQSRRTEQKS